MHQLTFGIIPAVGPAVSYLVGHQVSHNKPTDGTEPVGLFPWVAQRLPSNAMAQANASSAAGPAGPMEVPPPSGPQLPPRPGQALESQPVMDKQAAHTGLDLLA